MKITLIEEYHINGQLDYRFYITEDGKRHGFHESYKSDSSIFFLRYFNNGKKIKLENNYWYDIIEINYYI